MRTSRNGSGSGARHMEWVLVGLTVAAAAVSAWFTRHSMNPDGISYLDLSDRVLSGSWHGLVNGYWNPLYPLLIGGVRWVLRPDTVYEFAAVHLANFIAFAASLVAFSLLVREIERRWADEASATFIRCWAYSLFAWSAVTQITLGIVTPDMLLSAFVYLSAALALRASSHSLTDGVLLGISCGLAYLAKSVMIPISVAFILAALPLRRGWRIAVVAAAAFIVVAGGYVGTLSAQKGRLTFGDTGKLAYGLYINGTPYYTHWQGTQGSGTPVHPTRRFAGPVEAYEFAGPLDATYPPWFDPSYWNEGLTIHFSAFGHLRASFETLKTYYVMFFKWQWAFAGCVILAVVARRNGAGVRSAGTRTWRLWFPAAAALGIYSILHVEGRYVGPFMVLVLLGVFLAVIPHIGAQLLAAATFAVVASLWLGVATQLIKDRAAQSPEPYEWKMAAGVRRAGLEQGDGVASVGLMISRMWPRLARVRVVAEVPDHAVDDFWRADPDVRGRLLQQMKESGARAVVAKRPPWCAPSAGWRAIDGTDGVLLLLGPPDGARGQRSVPQAPALRGNEAKEPASTARRSSDLIALVH